MSFLATISQRYAHVVLFIIFEIIAFVLIVNFNQKQREIFLHSSSLYSGSVIKKTAQLGDYLSLQESNDDLLKDNARLFKEILSMPRPEVAKPDSTSLPYDVIPARVISNNITSLRNQIIIDKGSNHGIQKTLGVTSLNGVLGIIKSTNKNYSTVLSLLHLDTRVSASIEGREFFGTVKWDGSSFESLLLTEIPKHASVQNGDKVITNGYSTVFPKGLEIGTVKSFNTSKSGAFYEIEVTPSATFSNLEHVYILKNNFADEILSLENE